MKTKVFLVVMAVLMVCSVAAAYEVSIISPAGGEIVQKGDQLLIEWETDAPVDLVAKTKILFTKNNGATWKLITSLPGNPGSFLWEDIPDVINCKSKSRIKIVLKDDCNATIAKTRSKVFTVAPPSDISPPICTDCRILSIRQLSDDGYSGKFELVLDFSSIISPGQKFFKGQAGYNQGWIYYPVIDIDANRGKVVFNWPNGFPMEFSLGKKSGSVENWVDPSCSAFFFNGHFKVTLGQKKICSHKQIDDPLIQAIEPLGNDRYRVYLDFTILPLMNYQSLFVMGQKSPNNSWIHYSVFDNFPCYYSDILWPDGGGDWKFSFGVKKSDGSEQWVDPTVSQYLCADHLCIDPQNP